MYQAKDHTFVICAYKENKYLEECIKSIINQTIKSNVLISTSTSNIYISQLAEKYKIPIIINHGLGDQADNFNFAYRSVKTKLVTICHQDDYYAKHYLEYLLKYSNQSKDLLLFFTDYQEVKETKLIKSNKLLKIKRIMLFPLKNKKLRSYQWVRKIILSFGNPICCPSVTYRKEKIHSVTTYETNIMGTVNILEAIRNQESIHSFVNVTTDKVYENKEWEWGYREKDRLDGFDPYSNSKSCSELVTNSYIKSFFKSRDIAVSACRAGNVIGGGDFAKDRIIPDCIRAMQENREIIVRNPNSIRPYQHVLEPVCGYLMLALLQLQDKSFQGNYNIGSDDIDCITTGKLVDLFCKLWGEKACWKNISEKNSPHEATFLKFDCSRTKKDTGFYAKISFSEGVKRVMNWMMEEKNNGSTILLERNRNQWFTFNTTICSI